MRKHRGEPVGEVNLFETGDFVTMRGALVDTGSSSASNVYYSQTNTPATYTSASVSS